jgi:hypothetical protein
MPARHGGCSERFSPKEVAPLEVMMDDVLAVLDAMGSNRTALFAFEEPNFVACMAAVSRPDRISHELLLDPSPTWIRDDEITWEWSHREWDGQISVARGQVGREQRPPRGRRVPIDRQR